MAHPTRVPKFGNWDANDQVPFTVVFDTARAGKGGGKMINPNDPAEYPGAFGLKSDDTPQSEEMDAPVRIPRKSSQQQPAEETGLYYQSQDGRQGSSEEFGHKHQPQEQHAGLPTRKQSGDGQGHVRAGAADGSRRGSTGGGGRETVGVEESPNHQMYQGRLGNRPGSPYWERKNPPEGGNTFAPSTPGKSRLRPGSTRADETPDRNTALPKFGAWDENDPSAGEGFTVIFNQARNEKKTGGPVRIPSESPAKINYGDASKQPQNSQQQQRKSSIWACCFGSSARE